MSRSSICLLLMVATVVLLGSCTALPPPREWGRPSPVNSASARRPVEDSPSPPEIRELDWSGALRIARERSPTLRLARARIERAEALLRGSRALSYPTLDVRGNYVRFVEAASFRGRSGGDGTGQSTRSRFFTGRGSDIYSAGADVSYSVFDGGKVYYEHRAAESAAEAARHDLVTALDDLELTVSTAFLNALVADGAVRISTDALRFTEGQEAQSRARELAGEGLRVDTLRFATRASEERQALNRAVAEKSVQIAVLSELLGVQLTADLELVRPESMLDSIEGDLVTLAVENRADFRAIQARVEEAGSHLAREEASWWPALNVFGSYGFISLDDLELSNAEDEFQFGGGLSMNIFEGGAAVARRDARHQELVELRSRQQELLLTIEREVRQFELELDVSVKNVEVSRETVALAEEVLTRVSARYQEGEAQVLDVTEAELQRTRAQLTFLLSRVNSVLSQARLRRALGLGLLREPQPQ
jgi:outer membrane protein TolC